MSEEVDSSTAVLREEYENAKERLDQQRSTLKNFGVEGPKMIRITLVYAGLLVTGFTAIGADSIFLQIEYSEPILHTSIYIAILGLGASLILNMIGYEARGVWSLAESEDISDVANDKYRSEYEYLKDRLDQYSERIHQNDELIDAIESSLAYGKVSLTISVGASIFGVLLSIFPQAAVPIFSLLIVISFIYVYRIYTLPDSYIRKEVGPARRHVLKLLGFMDRKD
jgi:hypothetical protein